MHSFWTLLTLTSMITVPSFAMIYQIPMPEGLQNYFDGARLKHNISGAPGEMIFWECMQRVTWQMVEQMGPNVTQQTRDYLNRLLRIAVNTADQQMPRYRKEYRMLTEDERMRFHNAIVALKNDTTLYPNVYSAFATLHSGRVIPLAHFGGNFLGWHRILCLIFETALRMKDPTVSLPYWASTLDNEMEDPTQSILWSELFLGNGDGFVTIGPFANFRLASSDSILNRNIGGMGSLLSVEGINAILTRNKTKDITIPEADDKYNLERQHNGVHVWVGGNMDDLSTSAEDPVFYLHHSFVDYVYEEFRLQQVKLGIDPQVDYPTNYGPPDHHPDARSGFGKLFNRDALSDVFADLVKYAPIPTCSLANPNCGSVYLKCNLKRHYPLTPLCMSLTRDEFNRGSDSCRMSTLTRGIQNSFAINQYCDIREWAYIPVKVVLQRPPEFKDYRSFPVINNEPFERADIFSTTFLHRNQSSDRAVAYKKCQDTRLIANKVFIGSHGLNYYGSYKDFAVLDQRHALAIATTYIGVKSAEISTTDAILYAYDSCGRTCKPYCQDFTMKPPRPVPCSGAIRVTNRAPRLYGRNYAEAVNMAWKARSPGGLPEYTSVSTFLTFYCDYKESWPWLRRVHDDKQPAARRIDSIGLRRNKGRGNARFHNNVHAGMVSTGPGTIHESSSNSKTDTDSSKTKVKSDTITDTGSGLKAVSTVKESENDILHSQSSSQASSTSNQIVGHGLNSKQISSSSSSSHDSSGSAGNTNTNTLSATSELTPFGTRTSQTSSSSTESRSSSSTSTSTRSRTVTRPALGRRTGFVPHTHRRSDPHHIHLLPFDIRCRLSRECTINESCHPCREDTFRICPGSKGPTILYAHCVKNYWILKQAVVVRGVK